MACREADVVVVGGARTGANIVLLERYGQLGGMGTGGLVTILPNMSDINGKQQIAGLCKEWVDRLDLRKVNIGALQDNLSKQGVPLPNRA